MNEIMHGKVSSQYFPSKSRRNQRREEPPLCRKFHEKARINPMVATPWQTIKLLVPNSNSHAQMNKVLQANEQFWLANFQIWAAEQTVQIAQCTIL